MTLGEIWADSRREFRQSSVCFQRIIADHKTKGEWRERPASLRGAIVRQITRSESRQIILEYEWLRTIGRAVACYGLFLQNELIGVANFGWPAGVASRDVCGVKTRHLAVCLERGACVHWAPKNSASFLISRATKAAYGQFGWQIFYAYADESAGEIGVVYQACNWLYIGQGCGRERGRLREDFVDPLGQRVSGRALRRRKLKKLEVLAAGWKVVYSPPKHKYIWFEGTRRDRLAFQKFCRYPIQPYPRRRVGTYCFREIDNSFSQRVEAAVSEQHAA